MPTKGTKNLWGLGLLLGALGGYAAWKKISARVGSLPTTGGRPGTALVTGASSGIGEAFAQHLAAEGYNLILVARRQERLESLAAALYSRHAVQTEVLPADLTIEAEVRAVEKRLVETDDLTLLVNNAGFGALRPFMEIELARQVEMIDLNVTACVRLAYAALPGMVARGSGAIINLGSVMAFAPVKQNVVYSATKRFMISFSQSLQAELSGTGVQIQALCPGLTRTEFHEVADFDTAQYGPIPEAMWMTPDEVVCESLAGLGRRELIVVPGIPNQLSVAMMRTPGIREAMLKLFNTQM